MSQPSSFDATIHVGYRGLSTHSANQTLQYNGTENYTDPSPYTAIPTAPSYLGSPQQEPAVSYPIAEPPVITTQPGSQINNHQGLSECPRGLESLALTDRVTIDQYIGRNGLIRSNYQFTIKNGSEEKIYTVLEQASCITRDCKMCTGCPYEMKIIDSVESEIIHIHYPFTCNCLCLCFKQSIEMSIPSDNMPSYIGRVQEGLSLTFPKFTIYNESGEPNLKIEGLSTALDVAYKITTLDGTQIGIIKKVSNNRNPINRSYLQKNDSLGLSFPINLDVKTKALCIGAAFLIKSLYINPLPEKIYNSRV